jgi:beta-1,4-mannosyl-glycoprotein beta-1,4-N-acetylglucosaminyltransferase
VTTFDAFMFGDELDMLECRLMEAEQYDVQHVLVEAPYDHQGNPKPLYYDSHKSRYGQWAHRITHVVADIPGPGPIDPWHREHAQREHLWAGLNDAEPDDIVLVCDVDEIPSPAAYRLQGIREMHALNMRLAMFAVDWVVPQETRIAVAGPRSAMHVPVWKARDNGMRSVLPAATGMGWHLTWLGGPGAIERKAAQFCHLELRDMILKANLDRQLYERGMTWHGDGPYPPPAPVHSMVPAMVDDTWPRYIRERKCPDNWFRPVEAA